MRCAERAGGIQPKSGKPAVMGAEFDAIQPDLGVFTGRIELQPQSPAGKVVRYIEIQPIPADAACLIGSGRRLRRAAEMVPGVRHPNLRPSTIREIRLLGAHDPVVLKEPPAVRQHERGPIRLRRGRGQDHPDCGEQPNGERQNLEPGRAPGRVISDAHQPAVVPKMSPVRRVHRQVVNSLLDISAHW